MRVSFREGLGKGVGQTAGVRFVRNCSEMIGEKGKGKVTTRVRYWG